MYYELLSILEKYGISYDNGYYYGYDNNGNEIRIGGWITISEQTLDFDSNDDEKLSQEIKEYNQL